MQNNYVEVIQFSNQTSSDKKLLKKFVDLHWELYKNEQRYIPLLNYEYLGFRLLGITGWFEPHHHFFKHGKMTFFLAQINGRVVGRTCAFVNSNHNKHHNDKVGFFGFFESIDDQIVANALLDAAAAYLKSRGMKTMRGPQNLPINEATPGTLIDGFDAPAIIYYHYNYPYYAKLFENYNMEIVKKVVGYDVPVQTPIGERLLSLAEKVRAKHNITIETFTRKRFKALKQDMYEIYNEAWKDNWGFVPFEREEFIKNLNDMKLIWDPKMFLFAYVNGERAAFFGAVPNIFEKMKPIRGLRRAELLRAAKMLLTKGSIKSFRLGYLGIRPKFRKTGLDAVLLSEAKRYMHLANYYSCDIGWVLEDNELVLRAANFMGGHKSRTYAIFQKEIG